MKRGRPTLAKNGAFLTALLILFAVSAVIVSLSPGLHVPSSAAHPGFGLSWRRASCQLSRANSARTTGVDIGLRDRLYGRRPAPQWLWSSADQATGAGPGHDVLQRGFGSQVLSGVETRCAVPEKLVFLDVGARSYILPWSPCSSIEAVALDWRWRACRRAYPARIIVMTEPKSSACAPGAVPAQVSAHQACGGRRTGTVPGREARAVRSNHSPEPGEVVSAPAVA